jgi:DNA repair exonuclease SbcCD ATPase subunit
MADLQDELSKRKELEKDLEYEEKTLDSKKEQAENARSEHQIRTLSVETFKNEIKSFEEEKKKKEKLFDYLNYIKTTLKDENVKQYAISNITPFLQSKTNEYLSETGHSYYVELDNWLNGTILGPGVGDCDFGNMSGGEGKSIDMALKFAMMDVARLQAGSYPDILVLDELLDSSIDTYGLEKLVDIVKHKQKEDELKVFIVSHREEMDQFGYDTLYNVTKENGFSTIMEM